MRTRYRCRGDVGEGAGIQGDRAMIPAAGFALLLLHHLVVSHLQDLHYKKALGIFAKVPADRTRRFEVLVSGLDIAVVRMYVQVSQEAYACSKRALLTFAHL